MPDRVDVWLARADLPAADLDRCHAALDAADRARLAGYGAPEDARRFTIARGALRILAAAGNQDPATTTAPAFVTAPASVTAPAVVTGPSGKPELVPGPPSNLSHSGALVAIAISAAPHRAVGIDVQQVSAADPTGLARRYFPAEEADYVASAPTTADRAARFARLWTRKEAVVKAAGGRILPNLKAAVLNRDVVDCLRPAGTFRVVEISVPEGYRAAVALDRAEPFDAVVRHWPEGTSAAR